MNGPESAEKPGTRPDTPRLSSRPRLGISSCLLGEKVRYDGRGKYDAVVAETLGELVEWVPVCPETGCGLPVPREPVRLAGDPEKPRLETVEGKAGPTRRMREFCRIRVAELKRENLAGFLFKSKSPSCGLCVRVYGPGGEVRGEAPGLFAAAWIEANPGLPSAEAEALRDPAELERWVRLASGKLP